MKSKQVQISSKGLKDFILGSKCLKSFELFNPPNSIKDIHLESNSIEKLKLISLTDVELITFKLENLKILMLDMKDNQIWKGTMDSFSDSLSICKNLTTMAISSPFVSDDNIEKIFKYCKKIEAISIHRSPLITDNLFQSLSLLENLLLLDIE